MPKLLLTLILSIGLLAAQKMVTKSITVDEDENDRIIKIESHQQDSTMKIIINRDGEIEELVLPFGDHHDKQIQEFLTQHDIDLDVFHCNNLKDFYIQQEPGGWLGVQIQSLTDQLRQYFGFKHDGGVLISEISSDSPAEKAGLKAGDIIIKVDDTNISSPKELQKVISKYDPESVVKIQFIRDKKEKALKVTLGEAKGSKRKHKFGAFDKSFGPDCKGDFDSQKHFEQYRFKIPKGMDDDDLFHHRGVDNEKLLQEMEELKKELKLLKEEMRKSTD